MRTKKRSLWKDLLDPKSQPKRTAGAGSGGSLVPKTPAPERRRRRRRGRALKLHLRAGVELSVPCRNALAAVISGQGRLGPYHGPCWVPVRLVERGAGTAAVAELLERGWLETWDGIAGGPALTLTPYAADQLDVELIEVGIDETPVWTRRSPENSTRPIRLMWHNWEFTVPLTEDLIDPAPPVDEFVINHLSGKPVLLWGRRIRRDKRLKAG